MANLFRRKASSIGFSYTTSWDTIYAYLKDVLTRMPTQRASDIDQLLPHQWVPA